MANSEQTKRALADGLRLALKNGNMEISPWRTSPTAAV